MIAIATPQHIHELLKRCIKARTTRAMSFLAIAEFTGNPLVRPAHEGIEYGDAGRGSQVRAARGMGQLGEPAVCSVCDDKDWQNHGDASG